MTGPIIRPTANTSISIRMRTGLMQIWRMKTDGSEQTQITPTNTTTGFAHPSPDGKWLVFLSYEKDVKGHPANKDVMLRLFARDGDRLAKSRCWPNSLAGRARSMCHRGRPTAAIGLCQLSVDRSP